MICMVCETKCVEENDSQFRCVNCDMRYEQAVFTIPPESISEIFESAKTNTFRVKENIMNNIQLTELNVYSVPVDWVYLRYGKLKRLIKMNKDPEMMKEAEIIEKFLESNGNNKILEAYSVEQIEMDIPKVLRKQYVPIVEERLEEHYLRMRRRNWLEQEIKNRSENLMVEMPKVTASFSDTGESGGGWLPSSPTENAVLNAYDRIDKLKSEFHEIEEAMYTVDKVLQELKHDQLNLVKALYFQREKRNDNVIMKELFWGRQKYYDIKKATLIKIAYKLNIL